MKIRFVTPPPAQSKGGIDNAIAGLAKAIEQTGRASVSIRSGNDFSDPEDLGSAPAVDLIHFHGLWQVNHAKQSKRLRRTASPYVVSPHGMLEPWAWRHRRWKKIPYFHLVERHHLSGASSLFVTSNLESTNLSRRLDHPRVETLPLGCDTPLGLDRTQTRLSLGWAPDDRVALYLSRIDQKKGLDRLLQALAGFRQSHPHWRIVVVGDGDEGFVRSVKSRARILEPDLPPIQWVGPVWGDDRWRYIEAADLFCLPTHSENFGIAVLESLQAGTPVLTTEHTPWADFSARHGVTICTSEVDSLRSAAADSMQTSDGWNPEDRTRLATWASAQFDWNKLANQYLEAYQRALG